MLTLSLQRVTPLLVLVALTSWGQSAGPTFPDPPKIGSPNGSAQNGPGPKGAVGGVTAPALLYKVEPEYTKEAQDARLQGTVVLYVEVDPSGRAVNPRVIRSLGMGLDENAIAAVSKWKFRPGYKDGHPVTVAATIEVNFHLLSDPAPTGVPQAGGIPGTTPLVVKAGLQPYEFVGALETLTASALSIRLFDGRIIQAVINPGSGAATRVRDQFVGDIVRVQCKRIPRTYDQEEDRTLSLAVVKAAFERSPTNGEFAAALSSRQHLSVGNQLRLHPTSDASAGLSLNSISLPAGTAATEDDFISKARTAINTYLDNVPNYIATETTDRYQSPTIPPRWKRVDQVRCEVRFNGNQETREDVTLNGKQWTEPFVMLPGSTWNGGFGTKLRSLFNPTMPVTFTLDSRTSYNGRPARVYEFRAPKDSLASWTTGYQTFYPAFEGKVTITESDMMVVRLESKAEEFPSAFPISSVEEIVVWDWVPAGDSRQLLPVQADVLIVQAIEHEADLNRLRYTDHRHFESSSNVSFGK